MVKYDMFRDNGRFPPATPSITFTYYTHIHS